MSCLRTCFRRRGVSLPHIFLATLLFLSFLLSISSITTTAQSYDDDDDESNVPLSFAERATQLETPILVLENGTEFPDYEKKRFTGSGKLYMPHNDYYEGTFEDGKMHGHGKLYEAAADKIYEGDITYGVPDGQGTVTDPKLTYKGAFKYGKPNGRGEMVTTRDGHTLYYQGVFVDGQLTGHGTVTTVTPLGNLTYEGKLFGSVKEGVGIEIAPDLRYEGYFKKGNYAGYGVLIIHRENVTTIFRGKFNNRTIVGRGVMEIPNMVRWEGEFNAEGSPIGYGIVTLPKETPIRGRFGNKLQLESQSIEDEDLADEAAEEANSAEGQAFLAQAQAQAAADCARDETTCNDPIPRRPLHREHEEL